MKTIGIITELYRIHGFCNNSLVREIENLKIKN